MELIFGVVISLHLCINVSNLKVGIKYEDI